TRRSQVWNSRPPDGWTGTTIAACTVPWEWFHQDTTKPPTTQTRPRSCNQYKSSTKPGAVQFIRGMPYASISLRDARNGDHQGERLVATYRTKCAAPLGHR